MAVIVYGLPATELAGVALVVRSGVPVTPDVASVSPFLNPVMMYVNGFVSP